MKVDPRFLTSEGYEIFTGSELVLKGALECDGGVHLLSGYPGSPIAGYFDGMTQLRDLLNEKGIRAALANNEALAAAMLNGSQMAGCRAIIAMKSVGVHVAADGLALGNLAGANTEGGAIVVYGDDPWCDSTQVPSDSRYISKHLFIPVIEPSTPQEIKDWIDLCFKISAGAELYMGLVITTNLADGGGSVLCRPNQYPAFGTRQKLTLETALQNLDKRVLLPPRTVWQEESLPTRFEKAMAMARRLGMNRIDYPAADRRPLGFITSGLAHGYLVQSLFELGVLGQYPILKLGMTYPADPGLVRELAGQCERMVVVEERRGFIEEQINETILKDRQNNLPAGKTELWGKQFPGGLKGIPASRGLHPSILISRLVPLLKHVHSGMGILPASAGSTAGKDMPANSAGMAPGMAAGPHEPSDAWDREIETIDSTARAEVGNIPARIPTFCPGCPHRDSADVCLEIQKSFLDAAYMQKRHGRGAADLIFHGDTGCYTLLMFPPNATLMHNYSGMGLGAGTGSGIDPFITNKQVVFMGDSTFFHSGQLAISQAIKLGQDITFIILDNRTTAMTGHQPTPGVEYDILGNDTARQDIDEIVRGIAGENPVPIVRADPQQREAYKDLLEETFLADGVKVIIADKECGITRTRRRRRAERAEIRQKGFIKSWQHMSVNLEACTFCLACAEMTACPGLRHVQTDYGPKIDTDITVCVDDGACERIAACSAFERVIIHRKRPPRSRVPELGLDEIPEPQKRPAGDMWRCYLAGVGGMGIGVATSILVRAGHKEGYQVSFLDKKGMAIRNGGVNSQVVFNISNQPVTAIIPFGKADLIIGVDVLEAARAIDPAGRTRIASRERTAAVLNTDKINTTTGLMGLEDFSVEELAATVRAHTRSEDFLARDISRICEKYLGSKLYANIMMLGFAFQKGLIPVSMHSMAWAIKDTIKTDHRKNLYAFNMGRKLVERQDLFQGAPVRLAWGEVLEEKCRCITRRYGKGKLADDFRRLALDAVETLAGLDESLKRDFVIRLYDCLRWGGLEYAGRYAAGVLGIFAKDQPSALYAATAAVIQNLAGAMLIKDPVFLAELATAPEKYARDREKYNVNPANGDRISYRHYWHANLRIGQAAKHYDVTAYDWMLQLLKRSKYLRKLFPFMTSQGRAFLADYEKLLAEFDYSSTEEYEEKTAQLASPRCLACMNPRCREKGCPLGNHIPQWVELAYRKEWQQASDLLHQTNNFPEFTAAICPAPCQVACKQSANEYPVNVRDIERQIVEQAFAGGFIKPQPPADTTGKSVAVIGSGPAGLAAAQQLARAGHDVTVFEKDPAPGGLLRYGIPTFRLERALIDRRVEQLKAEGVSFRCGVEVGRDISAAELRGQFQAVLIATGSARPRDLKIPGRDHQGIYLALDYLRQQNVTAMGGAALPDELNARGKTVAVLGGGDTGQDCVDIALAQGAREVYQLEILPEGQTNGGAHGPSAGSAAVHKRYCVSTREFNGDARKLRQLRAVEVRWANSPAGKVCVEKPGSEFSLPIDLAVLALGYEPAADEGLVNQFGLQADARGRIVTSDFATNSPGVFAAGDLAVGPSQVVKAIHTGRRAARRIDAFLR